MSQEHFSDAAADYVRNFESKHQEVLETINGALRLVNTDFESINVSNRLKIQSGKVLSEAGNDREYQIGSYRVLSELAKRLLGNGEGFQFGPRCGEMGSLLQSISIRYDIKAPEKSRIKVSVERGKDFTLDPGDGFPDPDRERTIVTYSCGVKDQKRLFNILIEEISLHLDQEKAFLLRTIREKPLSYEDRLDAAAF